MERIAPSELKPDFPEARFSRGSWGRSGPVSAGAQARPALEPGHAERGIAHGDFQMALTLLGGQHALGLGFHAGPLPFDSPLRRLLLGREAELRLQLGVRRLNLQRLDLPKGGLPLALLVKLNQRYVFGQHALAHNQRIFNFFCQW